jgi:hypothetical protein
VTEFSSRRHARIGIRRSFEGFSVVATPEFDADSTDDSTKKEKERWLKERAFATTQPRRPSAAKREVNWLPSLDDFQARTVRASDRAAQRAVPMAIK